MTTFIWTPTDESPPPPGEARAHLHLRPGAIFFASRLSFVPATPRAEVVLRLVCGSAERRVLGGKDFGGVKTMDSKNCRQSDPDRGGKAQRNKGGCESGQTLTRIFSTKITL